MTILNTSKSDPSPKCDHPSPAPSILPIVSLSNVLSKTFFHKICPFFIHWKSATTVSEIYPSSAFMVLSLHHFYSDLPSLTTCSIGTQSMCGTGSFNAYFVNLPRLENLQVGEESLRHCETVYAYGAMAQNQSFGAFSFQSLKYATLLTQNPLEDTSDDAPPSDESSFIDDGGRSIMNSPLAAFPISFHHLHFFITKAQRSVPILVSSLELDAFHHRFHLRLPSNSLTECPLVNFGNFSNLRWLHVDDHALTNLHSLTLSHLPALETLELASYVGWGEERAEKLNHTMELFDLSESLSEKTFCVCYCPRLRSIIIGGACFCDYEKFEVSS